MKILRVTSAGFLEGGAEQGIVHIGKILEERGHTVKILASDLRPDLPHFNEYTYRAPHGPLRRLMFTCNLSAYCALKRVLREYKPDVVHLHTLGMASPLVFAALSGYPVVATVHGPEVYTRDLLKWSLPLSDFKRGENDMQTLRVSGYIRFGYYRYINYPLYRLGLRRVDRFVSISGYIQRVLERQGIESELIRNGIALFPYAPLTHSMTRHLVFTGRLKSYKGADFLLRAMPRITAAYADARLSIAGDGDQRLELEKLAKDLGVDRNVEFLGHVGRAKLEELYKSAAVVVVPSVWPEIASRSGIEAMSVGRAIIGTDVGGTPDWLVNGENGYLVPPKDADAIAGAALTMFANEDSLIRMGEKARAMSERYDVALHATRIEEVYREVIAQREQMRSKKRGTDGR